MGADYHLYLFNLRTFKEKVFPAYQAYLKREDPQPIISLLKDCIQKLEANQRLSEQLRLDKELFEDSINTLSVAKTYSSEHDHGSSRAQKKTGKVSRGYVRELISSRILEVLCVAHDNDKGVAPEQDMGANPLISYLYEKSEWIQEMFTGIRKVRGGRLELPIGDYSELFTKEDIRELLMELNKVPPPEGEIEVKKMFDNENKRLRDSLKQSVSEDSPQFKQMYDLMTANQQQSLSKTAAKLRQQYNNLRMILELALDDPDLTLILSLW